MRAAEGLRVFLARAWAGPAMAAAELAGGIALAAVNRAVGAAVLAAGAALLAGAAVAAVRSRRGPPPVGDVYVIGGRPVHLLAEGEAKENHPVIWASGGHGEGLILYHLHARIRGETRSFLFDRTGSGWTGPAAGPVTVSGEVEQLAKLLDAAGETGPFVLAGHSFGGLFCANFAHRFPERTAAVLLLDSTPPWNMAFAGRLSFSAVIRRSWWGALKSHFGLHRWVEPEIDDPDSAMARELADVADTINRHSVEPKSLLAEASVFRAAMDNPFDLVIGEGDLGDIPLVLLSANPTADEQPAVRDEIVSRLGLDDRQAGNLLHGLRDSVEQQVRLSSRGVHKRMPAGATHAFPYEFPDEVLAELRELIRKPPA